MRRRTFSRFVSRLAVLAAPLSVLPVVAQTQAAFKEGAEYLKLAKPAPVDAPQGKVEVVEFFGYWCPHCAKFEPTFDAWAKKAPAHVVVRRNPIAFRPDQEPLQRLYFALEAMGKVDELHGKVFVALHGEKQRLATADQIVDWVAKQGVDRVKFLEFFNSFGVMGKVKRASQLAEVYQIDGVPTMGVAGRYFTSGTQAGTVERMLKVVEHLAESNRKG